MLDRSQAPDSFPIHDFALPRPTTLRLSNGLPVYVIASGKQAICVLQLVFRAGRWFEKEKWVSVFASKMIAEGSERYSARAISEAFDQIGAFWEVNAGTDLFSIEVYVLNKHVRTALDLLCELIAHATIPENEFELLKGRMHQQLKVNLEKTNYLAGQMMKERMFGDQHPYGYLPQPLDLEALKRDHVANFYQHFIQQRPFDIIVSGMVNDELLGHIESTLGRLAVRGHVESPQFPPVLGERFNPVPERPDAMQTSLRIAAPLFLRHHPDAIGMEVLNELFGGYFGSRLMQNIREEKGLTYGIYSSLIFLQHAGYLMISAEVSKENKEVAVAEIFKEIKMLTTEKVGEEELLLVKNYLAGNHIKSFNTPVNIADHFKTLHYFQLEPDYFDNYIEKVNEITAERLMELANQYFDEKGFLTVTVG